MASVKSSCFLHPSEGLPTRFHCSMGLSQLHSIWQRTFVPSRLLGGSDSRLYLMEKMHAAGSLFWTYFV